CRSCFFIQSLVLVWPLPPVPVFCCRAPHKPYHKSANEVQNARLCVEYTQKHNIPRRPYSSPTVLTALCIHALSYFQRYDFCRSEEHTSELQSRENLVCRLLLAKKK